MVKKYFDLIFIACEQQKISILTESPHLEFETENKTELYEGKTSPW